jgi:hypothetical protein
MKTPAVILINPKSPHNVGKALRAASIFGAKALVWTGTRVDLGQYDRLPREERMKGFASVEFCVNDRPFDLFPEATPVCVELLESAECLTRLLIPQTPSMSSGLRTEACRPSSAATVTSSFTYPRTIALT